MTLTVIPSSVRETWKWKTDKIRTIDGTESRFSLRPVPRIDLQNTYNTLTQAQRKKAHDRLRTIIKGAFFTPIWPHASYLDQDAAALASRLYFDPQRVPVDDGGELLLIRGDEYQFVTVDTVETDGATLTDTLAQAVTTKWLVCLAMNAIIPNIAKSDVLHITEDLDVEFSSWNANVSVQRPGSTATLTTFNSLPVLDKTMIGNQSGEYKYDRAIVDYGNFRAQQSQLPWAGFKRGVQFFINRMFSPEDYDWWRLFLDTTKGAWKPFYLTTGMEDLTVASGSGASITFSEDTPEGDDPAYSAIEVELDDGTISRHVLSEKSGSSYTVTPAFPAGTVRRISHLLRCYMSDTIVFEHGGTGTFVNFDVFLTDT